MSTALAPVAPPWLDTQAWPFPARFVPLAEGRVHVVDEGTGPVVLLVHGTPSWSFDWRHVIRDLSRDHRVIAFDHLGFGLSDRPRDAGYRPEDHARRFRELLDALDLGPVHVVVHDFGGPIALDTVLAQPERFLSVTIVNTWMWSFDDDPSMRLKARVAGSWLGRMLYRYANASLRIIAPSAWGDRRKLTPAIQSQLLAPFRDRDARERVLWALATSLLGSSAYYDTLWARRATLERLRCLIVWGRKDTAFGPEQLDRWRRTLPGARAVVLDHAGHWPHEEAPDEFVAALRSHVNG